MKMTWFLAKIIFSITSGNGNHTPQFDEQLRLVSANNKHDAFLKARFLGYTHEDTFENHKNETVKWAFVDVLEVIQLDSIKDGMEIYSTIHEEADPKTYVNFIQEKAKHIQTEPVNLSLAQRALILA